MKKRIRRDALKWPKRRWRRRRSKREEDGKEKRKKKEEDGKGRRRGGGAGHSRAEDCFEELGERQLQVTSSSKN